MVRAKIPGLSIFWNFLMKNIILKHTNLTRVNIAFNF